MSDELKRYPEDVIHSISMIEKFLSTASDFQQYEKNDMLKSAVQWHLSLIGEALSNALKIEPSLAISNARKIVDMRNKLIHGYDEIEDTVVWNVIIKHLPQLKIDTEKFLN